MSGSARLRHTQAALDRFAELIARHEEGQAIDFARELEDPPELALELRELHENWSRLRGLLESAPGELSELQTAGSARGGNALSLDRRTRRLLGLLARFRGSEARYEVLGEIARGGMGMVLRVRERGIERELALKRMFSADELSPAMRPLRAQLLRRLLDEAWILSRLDHPGIVTLHELGVDEEGRVYFTMPLVRGRTLAEIFVLARARREGWDVARVSALLQRVCEALSFAHSIGIVHRDLKPANVMVGRFGEVQVMDWGLAHARRGPESEADAPADSSGALDGDAAVTLDGEVLGTPAYMAPEQALGEKAVVCPRSDVYSVGAMLYELLAGERPYHEHATSTTARKLLEQIKAGPPAPIEPLAQGQPPELVAICRKAMARDPEQRYPSMQALAEDLRAFREERVVRAHESGAWAELRKWIRRNRRVSAALGFGIASLLAAAAITLWVSERAEERVRFESFRLEPAALAARASALWPPTPERVPALEQWLAEAQLLVASAAGYRRELEDLRRDARVLRSDDPLQANALRRRDLELRGIEIELLGIQDELRQLDVRGVNEGVEQSRKLWMSRRSMALEHRAELLAVRPDQLVFSFADRRLQARHDVIVATLAEIQALLATRPYDNSIEDLRRRLELALRLPRESLEARAGEWAAACAAIADPRQSPLYQGLRIEAQLGLVPIGPDRLSGLWEFSDLASGAPARRGPDGKLVLAPETGIVFVLVPEGWCWIGAHSANDPSAADESDADPDALPQEMPAHKLHLQAFFLSKYELTQAQWMRLSGTNPSYNSVGKCFGGPTADLCYPVDHMSWSQGRELLEHYGYALPSEAQWEYAARAGTRTRYWWGNEVEPACLLTNSNGACPPGHLPTSLRCDSFEPNPWGFYCILGNLAEWTSDNYWTSYRWEFADDGSGRQLSPDSDLRVVRGGCYGDAHAALRVSWRADCAPDQPTNSFGLRPMRPLEP